eukprot:COSAG01_NODE_145_length_24103_cov_41.178012_17_plen_68_part_00
MRAGLNSIVGQLCGSLMSACVFSLASTGWLETNKYDKQCALIKASQVDYSRAASNLQDVQGRAQEAS